MSNNSLVIRNATIVDGTGKEPYNGDVAVKDGLIHEIGTIKNDYDKEIDEFEISGLTPIDCVKVKPPRVKESKVSFECSLNTVVEIGGAEAGAGFIVIGTIVMFHIDDMVYKDGHIDLEVLNPIGRLAGNSYTRIIDTFFCKNLS